MASRSRRSYSALRGTRISAGPNFARARQTGRPRKPAPPVTKLAYLPENSWMTTFNRRVGAHSVPLGDVHPCQTLEFMCVLVVQNPESREPANPANWVSVTWQILYLCGNPQGRRRKSFFNATRAPVFATCAAILYTINYVRASCTLSNGIITVFPWRVCGASLKPRVSQIAAKGGDSTALCRATVPRIVPTIGPYCAFPRSDVARSA